MKMILLFLMLVLSISFVTALSVNIPTPINYSTVNVNNSDYLDGYDSSDFLMSETDPVWSADKPNYITSAQGNSTYWTKGGAPQLGLTSDKDGSFNLATSGYLWAEQLTSTDDITMAGLLTNSMGTSDVTGLSISQPNYTGGSNIALASITGVQKTPASNANKDISGLTHTITNNHDLTGSMGFFFQGTTGLTNTVTDASQFPTGSHVAIFVNTWGIKNTAKKTSSTNIYATQDPMFGDPTFATYGMHNDVSTTSMAFYGANNYVNNLYGVWNYVHPATHGIYGSATTTTTSYGDYILMAGNAVGTTTGYGVYISSLNNFDTAYSIWDNSGQDWVLDADDQMIRLGETQGNFDIFYNGTVPYLTTNSAGGFHFKNSTAYAELHAHDFITHTHNPTSENTLEGFEEDTELYDVYTEVEDTDNCTQVLENTIYVYDKDNSTMQLDYEIPEEYWEQINITNVTIIENYNTVCGTKLIKGKSGGQLIEDLQSMATKLNKNINLHDNLTDFDTGIMAEDIYLPI